MRVASRASERGEGRWNGKEAESGVESASAARARAAAHVEGSANLSICARSTLVTMSLTSAPATAPKVTPTPMAHGATTSRRAAG